jgi:hypothetical protein
MARLNQASRTKQKLAIFSLLNGVPVLEPDNPTVPIPDSYGFACGGARSSLRNFVIQTGERQ